MKTGTGTGTCRGPDLRSRRALDGDPASIAAARAFASAFLRDAEPRCGPFPARAVNDVQLVVSELVTNAVKYAPGPCEIGLEIDGRADGTRLVITVRDAAGALPVIATGAPERIGRHGLEIVHALSESVQVRREPPGKRVTATVALVRAGASPAGGGDPATRWETSEKTLPDTA